MVKRRLSCELDPARQPGAGASAPQLSPRRPRPSPRVCWRARSTLLRRERSAKLAPSRGGMLNQSRNQKLSRLHHPLHGGQPFFALVSTPRRKSSSKSPMTGAVTCSASVSQNTRFAPDCSLQLRRSAEPPWRTYRGCSQSISTTTGSPGAQNREIARRCGHARSSPAGQRGRTVATTRARSWLKVRMIGAHRSFRPI